MVLVGIASYSFSELTDLLGTKQVLHELGPPTAPFLPSVFKPLPETLGATCLDPTQVAFFGGSHALVFSRIR